MFAGQVSTGACVSLTVMLNEQLAVLRDESMAVQVTACVPVENLLPEGGEQLTVTAEQRSLAVGVGNSTTAEHWPASVVLVIFAGQVIEGGWLSLTVIVKLHDTLLLPLVAVQVTVVTPAGKNEPDGGLHVAVPVPAQLFVTTGGG